MWIKICATTNLDDALLAADLGADAIGFVFAPSPRQVTADRVAAITPHLPDRVEKVGVFIGSTEDDLTTISLAAKASGLTALQLHGGVDLAFTAALQDRLGPAVSIIHTVHWSLGPSQEQSAESVSARLDTLPRVDHPRVLIDAKAGTRSGGLGIPFDWAQACPVFQAHPWLSLIVAGGLSPYNVNQAVHQLRPYGIDVASGVELTPGRKNETKLRAFMRKAREATE